MYEAELLQEETDALEHYGIKGQKWGERRFQNPDGTYTELGKERRRVGYEDPDKKKDEKSKTDGKAETPDIKIGGKAYKDMTKKELRAAKKRARHNEAERRAKREFNRDKREAIENGDIAFISKNISKFTNDEIDESIKRYKKMQDVWNLDKANRKDADHYLDKAIHYLSKMDSLSKSMTNIYNNFTESGKKKEEKRSQKYLADQNYYKSLQEQWRAEHPGSSNDNNKDKKDDKNNKGSKENVEKEKQNLKDLKGKEREEEAKRDREAREEEAKRKREWEKEDREEKWKERERKQQEKFDREDERDREKEERRREKEQEKEERRREKEQEKEERRREKEQRKREEEEEKRREREDFADDLFRRTEAKRKEREEKEAREREERAAKEKQKLLPLFEDDDDYAWLDNIDFGSQNKKKFGGWFSKDKNNNKDNKNNKEDWRKTYDELEKQLNEMNNKYLNQMNNYYSNNNKFGSSNRGSSQRNKSNKELPLNTTRDNRWRKQIEKSHDSRVVDKWVKEMTKKYETERNMDKKTAEKYAERYVDYWLERYDEDIAKSL